jgi:periplasmic protein CpxP/Spy
MNQHYESGHESGKKTSTIGARRWIAVALASALVGMTAAAGASYANEGGALHAMHGHGAHMAMDPAAMEKHVDAMVAHVLADGTDEQKAKVAAIVKAAFNDLRPMHVQMREAHAKAAKLLSAPVIDRAALEDLRAEQMRQADAASKRIVLAVEDAADALTPAQRAKLYEHMMKRHEMMH